MSAIAEATPVVSVIIPAFNAAPFITATVESALGQSFRSIEVVVIDDGSSDGTAAQLRGIEDPRLIVIRQSNKGAPAALNKAIGMARGVFIAFLDHDDLWLESKIERHMAAFAQHPELTATFSWYGLIDEPGRRIHVGTPHWRGPIEFRQLLEDFVIGCTSSLVMRREAILEAGGFDERFPRCHDFDLVLRVSLRRRGSICSIPEELTLYRRHSGQMSRDWRAMHGEWEALIEKMGRLAPRETAQVEALARSNVKRYYACLAYEEGDYAESAAFIRGSFRAHPRAFLLDWRSWRVMAACCSGMLLPRSVHRRLERMAGVHRQQATVESSELISRR